MKTLLLITFKIIEVIGLVLVYLGLCKLGYLIDPDAVIDDKFWYSPLYIILPVMIITGLWLCVTLIYGLIKFAIPWWINQNKKLIDKIWK